MTDMDESLEKLGRRLISEELDLAKSGYEMLGRIKSLEKDPIVEDIRFGPVYEGDDDPDFMNRFIADVHFKRNMNLSELGDMVTNYFGHSAQRRLYQDYPECAFLNLVVGKNKYEITFEPIEDQEGDLERTSKRGR